MESKVDDKAIPRRKGTMTKNSDLDVIFGGRILFPEKNRLAEEQISKYGLPGGLMAEKKAGR